MRVLITGGSGSFGNACVDRLLEHDVERVVVYSRSEHKHVDMANRLGINLRGDKSPVRLFIGDVRDQQRLKMAMWGITHVIHAAALKVVPSGEYNPTEFIRTNVGGASNVIHAAIETGVERVVALSTDKAAAPVNLYGATKLCAEKAFVAANALAGGRTKFSVCRYGNITGSTGSVVPTWWALAKKGEPLPVTNPQMTRFWMTLTEAVDFVLGSIEMMQGGEVFVPHLPSYYLEDLANAVWKEARQEHRPYLGRPIGVRPGEKMHESMLTEDESPWVYVNHDIRRYAILQESRGDGWEKVAQGWRYRSDENNDQLGEDALRHELQQLGYE